MKSTKLAIEAAARPTALTGASLSLTTVTVVETCGRLNIRYSTLGNLTETYRIALKKSIERIVIDCISRVAFVEKILLAEAKTEVRIKGRLAAGRRRQLSNTTPIKQ